MPKVVIVPGQFMVDNNKIHDGMGFGAQLVPTPRDPNTFLNNSYPTAFMYNPMLDYMAWHGMNEVAWVYANVYIGSLKSSYTSLNELGEYMEANVKDTVLVQRATHDMWNMYFKNPDDRKVYDEFLRIHTPTYVKIENWPQDIERAEWDATMNDLREWCKETLQERYEVSSSSRVIYGSFKSDGDAAMFKLKWTFA